MKVQSLVGKSTQLKFYSPLRTTFCGMRIGGQFLDKIDEKLSNSHGFTESILKFLPTCPSLPIAIF